MPRVSDGQAAGSTATMRDFLPPHAEPRLRRSALASSFVAALELARLGKAELEQEETFGPLRLRGVKA